MCYTGLCDFEQYGGDCRFDYNSPIMDAIRDLNIDLCLCGHYDFSKNDLSIEEQKTIESQRRQIDFLLALNKPY